MKNYVRFIIPSFSEFFPTFSEIFQLHPPPLFIHQRLATALTTEICKSVKTHMHVRLKHDFRGPNANGANEADNLLDPKIGPIPDRPLTFEQDNNILIFKDNNEVFSYNKLLNSTFNTIIPRTTTVNSKCIKHL